MNSKSFGIDHPLIAVQDMVLVRSRFESIGFNMTPVGKHPWGTSTSLAIFPDCLLEIMSIYDADLIDVKPAGNFKFGRHVYEHLLKREGVALTALHSTDSSLDAQTAHAAGWELSGHLEFGRDVVLPDGDFERTKTTLALLPNSSFPRLSFFLCQQHRRDLVEVPQWMNHRNTACGINGVTIKSSTDDLESLLAHLEAVFGKAEITASGFTLHTPNGYIKVLKEDELGILSGRLPAAIMLDKQPSIIAMDIRVRDIATLIDVVDASGMAYTSTESGLTLDDASLFGSTVIQFSQQ